MERSNTNILKIAESAVDSLVNFLKPTFGPNNQKILTKTKRDGVLAVDDGYRLAMDVTLENPLENAILDIVKENLKRFNQRYGEGTTGFLLLLQALLKEIGKLNNVMGVPEELFGSLDVAKKEVKMLSKEIKTEKDLRKIATTSFSNKLIAQMISEFLYEAGPEGKLGMDRSHNDETFIEKVDGYEIEDGLKDSTMPKMLEKPYILLTDKILEDGNMIVDLMDKLIQAGSRNLVIVAKKVDGSALATILQNHQSKAFSTQVIEHSSMDALEDLSLITGAPIHLQLKPQIDVKELGKAKTVISNGEKTLFVSLKQNNDLKKKCIELRKEITENPARKERIEQRLAKLNNIIGVIKIGSPTPKETLAIQYKIEDAIHAVRLAQKGGVVCGAGLTMARITTPSQVLNKAMKYPKRQLIENHPQNLELTEKEAMELGIYDPTEVIIGQLEGSVSTASLLASLAGIQVEKENENNN